ncbi:uncharacterized protein LOC8284795 [Ricinus communis]|uniref:uncharacterized protein LOC8284795 n=1 Tax=Ricinus communis TaxID=3988 RepID=UPI00201A30D8|nr:uncharacterized protein LOC8284795 [Ricinus communis]
MSLLNSSKPMDSSPTHSDRAQNVSKECDSMVPSTTKHASSRRTPSLSSSSSFSSCSSSNFRDESPLSPATPLRFSGVPFSWEHLPGIPKKSSHKKKDTALTKVLPLPPPAMPQCSKRFSESFGNRDPFFAALVACSKDDSDDNESGSNLWSGAKVSRSISDRFGFINLYTSCKRTCAVSESIVYLPRSNRTSYDLITRRSR